MTARRFFRIAAAWMPIVTFVVVTAPAWLFFVRLWWSWTHALLTKPWGQIFCIGNGCLS